MNNTIIYLIDAVTVLAIFGLLLAFVRWWQKKHPNGPAETTTPTWKKALRLSAFGLFALVLVTLGLMLVRSYEQIMIDSAPAPSQVEVPAALPFDVQEVSFLSEDGLRIAGWYVPPQNGATVILLHGYGGNRLDMRWHAEVLSEYGYGVLLYDERASGESQGNYRSFGWEDSADVGGALMFLQEQQNGQLGAIGIAGCSIGGQIALQGAAYYPEIGAVWADGASSIRAGDIKFPSHPLGKLLALSNFILDPVFAAYLGLKMPAGMLEILPEIAPRPIMLVAGGIERPLFGSEVPQMEHFAAHAGQNAQVWTIEESFHCNGPQVLPDEYARRMVAFFSQALEVPTLK